MVVSPAVVEKGAGDGFEGVLGTHEGGPFTPDSGEGGGVVAVALRDRPFVAILGDMIEGVVVVNQINAPDSDHVRTALWSILSIHGYVATQEVDVHVPVVQPRVA